MSWESSIISSLGFKVGVSLELWSLLVVIGMHNLQVLSLQKRSKQVSHVSAWHNLLIDVEELHVNGRRCIFVQEKVAIGLKQLRDVLSLHGSDRPVFELQVNGRWEFT